MDWGGVPHSPSWAPPAGRRRRACPEARLRPAPGQPLELLHCPLLEVAVAMLTMLSACAGTVRPTSRWMPSPGTQCSTAVTRVATAASGHWEPSRGVECAGLHALSRCGVHGHANVPPFSHILTSLGSGSSSQLAFCDHHCPRWKLSSRGCGFVSASHLGHQRLTPWGPAGQGDPTENDLGFR